jgi:hypothetical protein
MTTPPESPEPTDSGPVPPSKERADPTEEDEMMLGGDVGQLKGGHGRGHRRDEDDDEDEAARRNVGG